MKKVYRHIGYYEGQDALDMFCFDADSLVACMTAGPFHSSDGESETDIENLDDEEDKYLFSKSSDQEHLVRYSRGGNTPKADGWFIDIYRLMEVESDDQEVQDYPDHPEMIEEFCEHCVDHVELTPEFRVHTCPNCGKAIVACTLCPLSADEAQCSTCPLAKLAEQQNQLNEYGVKTTVIDFCSSFNGADISLREQGFEIAIETEFLGMVVYTIYYNRTFKHCLLYRRHAGGNAYTVTDSAISASKIREGLRELTGCIFTDDTPIWVRQVK